MPPEDTTDATAPAPAAHPPEVLASIATALDIASVDLVNLQQGADYLRGAHPST